ncbi:histidine phosphatase family protein [Priestia koreensis]|uniref:histidine phosphatase family protein n=1 Tax=Priestia koreensis TaxID=284581 RepID=UPI0006A97AAE|nr:histidine phosphatase family protein [Priestia koreensis]
MDQPMVITLIRHGLTENNQKKQYIGWSDPPLLISEEKRIRPYTEKVDLVVGSDLTRCKETSKLLLPNHLYVASEKWREMNFGAWEEKTYNELKEQTAYQNWLNDPFHAPVEDGELFSTFSERIWRAFHESVAKLKMNGGRNLVIVTHGGPIRLVASTCSGTAFFDWNVAPGDGIRLIGQETDENTFSVEPFFVHSEE